MSISLELIEQVRAKANVSYAEAKEALEQGNEDVLEALIYLEKQDKIKAPPHATCSKTGFGATVKRLVKTSNETKFVVSKNGNTIINLPVTIAIIVAAVAAPLTAAGLVVAVFTNHKLRLEKPDGGDMKINKTLDDISTAASKVSDQVADAISNK